MTTKTVVHLLRHGEVDNPKGVLYGRLPDYHLSDLGRQMADRVAETLKDRDISYLVAPKIGIGFLVRYVIANADLPSVPDLKIGGFQFGGGARFRF